MLRQDRWPYEIENRHAADEHGGQTAQVQQVSLQFLRHILRGASAFSCLLYAVIAYPVSGHRIRQTNSQHKTYTDILFKDMNLFEHVGAKIREFRTQFGGKGLSQEALANELSVATNTISRWETSTYHPTLEDLDKLARFFGRSILEFFPDRKPNEDERLTALLRTAKQLDPSDLEELSRYAEFRKARSMISAAKSKPGTARG
jgi:transcriptional regulator with XRE-family HTH domain